MEPSLWCMLWCLVRQTTRTRRGRDQEQEDALINAATLARWRVRARRHDQVGPGVSGRDESGVLRVEPADHEAAALLVIVGAVAGPGLASDSVARVPHGKRAVGRSGEELRALLREAHAPDRPAATRASVA